MARGGSRSFVTNLCRELARDSRGLHFTLLVQEDQLEGIDTRGVEVTRVRLPQGPLRIVWRVACEELVLPLRALRFDLLFCVADLAPLLAWTPTVVLLRNLNIYDRRWYDDARTRTLARLVRWGLPRARRLVFPSRAAARLISERMPVAQDRTRVVPYGIASEAFAPAGAPRSAEGPYVFLAAAVERHKNIEVLIDGLAFVQDPSLEIRVAGNAVLDPDYKASLERRAAAAGVAQRLHFLGAVPYHDILDHYRGAAAFVFPSFIETFGHPLLEAMLAGVPMVVSDIPAFHEIAGDAALYFPPDDARALARAIDAVQADPEAARRRVEAGRAVAEEFSWERSVDGFCAVFREVLDEGEAAG